MLGAIAGDIIGSIYEGRHHRIKTTDFPLFDARCRFTDDTVLTIATAEVLLHGLDYAAVYRAYGRRYPDAGYGGAFIQWIFDDQAGPYNSWGNGSAMRVSPIGWAFDPVAEVLAEAERSAAVTHNHPEGSKGRRPPPWPSIWPAPATPKRPSNRKSSSVLATTLAAGWMISAPATGSRSPARGRCRRR
jgi:ADP-ribosylglycohydrolase